MDVIDFEVSKNMEEQLTIFCVDNYEVARWYL